MCWLCNSPSPNGGIEELRIGGDFSPFGANEGQGYKIAPNTIAVPLAEHWDSVGRDFPPFQSKFFALVAFPNANKPISSPSSSYMEEVIKRRIFHRLRKINARIIACPSNCSLLEKKWKMETRLKNVKSIVAYSLRRD